MYITVYNNAEYNNISSIDDFNNDEYKKMKYTLTYKCPDKLAKIIHSIRQCVSNCSNYYNKIELEIFINISLYFYNNICYNNCQKGRNEDNKIMTCIEVYN